ncbi:MAG: hypothetical protein U0P45_01580 [Acidimicrobiales bacterium]
MKIWDEKAALRSNAVTFWVSGSRTPRSPRPLDSGDTLATRTASAGWALVHTPTAMPGTNITTAASNSSRGRSQTRRQ